MDNKTLNEYVRLADVEPLVLVVSALADYLWGDFVRETKPTVNYLIDRYDIRQLSRFGKEIFECLYQGGNVTPLVSFEDAEEYFRAKQDGLNPALPKGYKPEATFWVGLMTDLCNAPAWPALATHCVGDQFNSGNNAICLLNELSEVLEEQIELGQLPTDLLAHGGDKLAELREAFIEAKKQGNDQKAAELRQQGKELGKAIEQMLNEAREQMQPKVADAVDRAKREADATEEAVSSFAGTEAGQGRHTADLEEKRALARKLGRNRKLKQLATRLGGLRKAWNDRKRAKRATANYSDVIGAKFSDEVTKAFPIEMALAASQKGRALFALKYAQKTLLTKDYEAKLKDLDKGPVVMYVDISGSMSGEAELWSKALAFVVAEECLKQTREVQIHLFDTIIHNSLVLDGKRRNNGELLDFVLTWMTAGGTSFTAVLDHAMTKADIDPKADILLITDGHALVPDPFIRRINRFKDEQGINFYSFCIGIESDVLNRFSDEVHTVDVNDDPESSSIFQKILL
jgi:uncharacterized protein with von Willebrand factor type A (vWA) domain